MRDSNCIFCKIAAGEVPSYKVYEDESFFAFLELEPINPGHTLLIPKEHTDYIFDLPENLYTELWLKARDIAPAIKNATNAKRIGISVEGFGVAHVHVHLVPINHGNELDPHNQKAAKPEELAEMAKKILG